MKSRVSIILALMMVIGVIAACGNTATARPGAGAPAAPGGESYAPFMFWFQQNGVAFTNVDEGIETDPADNWVLDFMRENTGVPFTVGDIPPYADTKVRFDLMMASGEIPDLVEYANSADLTMYGEQGAFMPLQDIIKNSPVFSGMYDNQQLIAMTSLVDGNIYALRGVPNNYDFTTICVRLDLVEEAGYTFDNLDEELSTPAKLLEAAVKIKDNYPDSWPFSSPLTTFDGVYYGYMFNTLNYGWKWYEEDKEVRHVFEDGYVIKMIEWFQQALDAKVLHPEFITMERADHFGYRTTHNTFVWSTNHASMRGAGTMITDLNKMNAHGVVTRMPTEPGTGREKYYVHKNMLGSYGFSINKKIANDDAKLKSIVKLLEFLASDEYQQFVDWGREGIEHTVVDGERRPTPEYAKDGEGRIKLCYNFFRINNRTSMEITMLSSIDRLDIPDSVKAEIARKQNTAGDRVAADIVLDTYNPFSYIAPLTDEMRNRLPLYQEECISLIAKAALGEISMAQFETERQRIVAEVQDITDMYRQNTADAITRYGF